MITTLYLFNNILTMAYHLDALYASVHENPDLCLSVPCKRKKKKEFVIPVVASTVAAVLVLLFIFSALSIYRRKRQGMSFISAFCNHHHNSMR
jgi:uncharacterized protein YybS (DUF2232 family)